MQVALSNEAEVTDVLDQNPQNTSKLVKSVSVGAVVLALTFGIVLFARKRGGRGVELERIVGASGHSITLRKRLEEAVTRRGVNPVALYAESSELGDAWRAVMSLVDRVEKEPEAVGDPAPEIRVRAQRLLDELNDAN